MSFAFLASLSDLSLISKNAISTLSASAILEIVGLLSPLSIYPIGAELSPALSASSS